MASKEELRYRPDGSMLELWHLLKRPEAADLNEVLLDGPAGTGKSRCTGELFWWIANTWPGCKLLVCRQTRVSLTDSWISTFEEFVVPPGHPILDGPNPENRRRYRFPNHSQIVLGGLDRPTRLFSTEWDVVLVVETTEISLDAWEKFHRSLRHQVTPFQILMGETNPDTYEHWLNQRCLENKTRRFTTTHRNNLRYWQPVTKDWTEEGRRFMQKLDMLTGVRKRRLKDGEWCAAEGQVWEEFDRSIHVVTEIPPWVKRDSHGRPIWKMVVAGVDWGWRAPGVIHIYGVDGDGRMYLLREVYRAGCDTDDLWVPWAKVLHQEYRVDSWQCDPEDPEKIDKFRKAGLPATAASNPIEVGLEEVRQRLVVQPDERARLYFLAGALRERDRGLHEAQQPCSVIEEIPAYVYAEDIDGKPIKEVPDPACADHGCDALRYAVRYVDRVFHHNVSPDVFPEETWGHQLKHPKEHLRR